MNHYDTLQVSRKASADVIRAAFRQLQGQYHPDRNPGNETAAELSRAINAAYEVLSDPVKRAAYDAQLNAAGPTPFPGGASRSNPFADFDPSAFVDAYPASNYGPMIDNAVKTAGMHALHVAGAAFVDSVLSQLPPQLRAAAMQAMAAAQAAKKRKGA